MTTDLAGPPILFVDLDGTVRHGKEQLGRFVNGPDDVIVFPEAAEMMRRWHDDGGVVVGVTNQAGVAAGHMSNHDCDAALLETNEQSGRLMEAIYSCRHAVDAGCFCRKPLPGMLILASYNCRAMHGAATARDRCLMVGDRPEDEQAALAAGVPFEDAERWRAQAGDGS